MWHFCVEKKKKRKGFNELFPSTSQSRWCVRGNEWEGRSWTDSSRGHRCPDTAEHLLCPWGAERSPRQSRGRKAKLCLPEEQGLPSPRLKCSHRPHGEHRAGTTLPGGSKEQWQHLFRLPLLLILHSSVLPDGFALLNWNTNQAKQCSIHVPV